MKTAIYFYLFLLPWVGVWGQKIPDRVMGKPNACIKPVEMSQEEYRKKFLENRVGAYSDNIPWIVVADRTGTETFTDPKSGQPFKQLTFKDCFYVVEEDKSMVRIGRGDLSGMKVNKDNWEDFGWVSKSNVLLWVNALQDARTGIHKKAFLLNKVKDVKAILAMEKKEIVQIFNGPATGTTIGNKTIYEFYFIFKKENDRYLIAKDALLSTRSVEESLVGWVPDSRVAEWNTRISLEPNFEEGAFDERKANPNWRVAAYGNEEFAQNHAQKGILLTEHAYWTNDPAGLRPDVLAQSNPRRFRGAVMRFPMLNDNGSYYRTGVIGEITVKTMSEQLDNINEVNYSGMVAAYEYSKRARDNYNILLVVEGTPALEPYRQSLAEVVTEIRRNLSEVPNVRFGVAVYRDVPEEQKGKLFDILPLTSDQHKAVDFIKNMELAQWYDFDPWTSMYYGLNQAVLDADFRKEDTNIIILIGQNGDYRSDRLRRKKDEKHKTFIETSSIVDKLCQMNIHLIALQCRNAGEYQDEVFARQCRNFLLENSKCQHDLVRGVSDYLPEIQIANPDIPELEEGNIIVLKGGTTVGKIFRTRKGSSMGRDELVNWATQGTNNVFDFTEKFWENMSQIVNDGSSVREVSSGEFNISMARAIKAFYEGSEKNQWTAKDVVNLAKQKYKLYAEVFVPKQIKGAKYDAFSYVLFMPRIDLEDYIATLRRLDVASDGSTDQQREQLFNTLVELLKQFTGDASLRNNDPSNTSVEELRQIMQGVAKEGLKMGGELDRFMISDFLNKRKMSDEKVRAFVKRILDNTAVLQKILKEGRNYEFLYKTNADSYYWIPIEYTF